MEETVVNPTDVAGFPFRLAAIDIDHTLVGPDKRVGAANLQAVRRLRDAGCRVVLASGRRHDNMLKFQRELGLCDFVVSTQGAIVRHGRRNQVLHEAVLAPGEAAELIAEGLRRQLTVMHWSRRGVVANERSAWIDRYVVDCQDPVCVTDLRGLAGERAEKIVWGAEPAAIALLARFSRERYRGRFEITATDDFFLEFTSPAATKAAGVAAVARHYGIEARQAIAFGDGNNDVSMLAWAGLGVAMNHGSRAARAAAKLIAPPGNPESGLARAVAAVFAGLDSDDDISAAA